MTDYHTILVAVDLSEESGAIIERARMLAGPETTVHLVYVQEPMEAVYMGVVPYGPVFVGMDQVEDRLKAMRDTGALPCANSSTNGRAAPAYASTSVLTVEAMWSRPMHAS